MAHSPRNARHLAILLSSLTLLAATGCPNDNNDPTGPSPSGNKDQGTTTRDMDPNTDQDMGLDMPGTTGDMPVTGGDMDIEGDMMVDVPGRCSNAVELGEVDTSKPLVLSGNTRSDTARSAYATGCGFGPAPELAWHLRVKTPVSVSTSLQGASLNWVLEVQNGDCMASTRRFCDTSVDTDFVLEADKDYLLVLEPSTNEQGSIDLQLDFTELACLPIGQTMCSGEALQVCAQGGTAIEQISCAAPCSMDACGGDLCENAIAVTSFPYRFESEVKGYFDTIDFNVENSCLNPDSSVVPGGSDDPNAPPGEPMPTPDEPLGPIATPGQEVVFHLPGLKQGDKLSIDASTDSADNVLFILDSCDKMTCHIGVDLGDAIVGWPVPADGDYTVIVDRTTRSEADFIVEFSLE